MRSARLYIIGIFAVLIILSLLIQQPQVVSVLTVVFSLYLATYAIHIFLPDKRGVMQQSIFIVLITFVLQALMVLVPWVLRIPIEQESVAAMAIIIGIVLLLLHTLPEKKGTVKQMEI